MGDETPNAGGQVPPTGQVPGAQGGSPTTPIASAPGDGMTLEQALDALKKVRTSEAAMRQKMSRLDELEAKESAAQQAAMTLEQKYTALQQEHSAHLLEMQSERTRSALERAAQSLGCVDPEFAASGIDLSRVTHDKAGHVTNAEDLMKEFLAKKAYLMPQASTPQAPIPTGGAPMNPGRTGGVAGQGGALSMDIIRNMGSAEYIARHAEISKFYARQTEENRRGGAR